MSVAVATQTGVVEFRVYGLPKTQGSTHAFMPKGARFPVVTHDNEKELRSWRHLIVSAAREVYQANPLEGALMASLEFVLSYPISAPGTLRTERQRWQWGRPWRKPDLDKLERAVWDALTGVLFRDDAQIVEVTKRKVYGAQPGVAVRVWRL